MENGSFHTSDEKIVSTIPLPNQLPKSLDFSEIPPATLKSATIESLISQNEDLMARLSVALRKNSQLEERLTMSEAEGRSAAGRLEALQERFLILQEKDRAAGSRTYELQTENVEIKAKLEKLERIYTDLYVQAQALQRRLVSLERYRARVRKVAGPIQERAKKFPEVERELSELQRGLSEKHMSTINAFEVRLSEARAEIQSLTSRQADRDQVFEQKVQIENQLIYEQRRGRIREEEQTAEIARLQSENSNLRLELKEKLVILESEHRELMEYKKKWPESEAHIMRLTEQVESLQALWSHKQIEMEKSEEKYQGLQKLNQSISQTLNQQRKEIQGLKETLERERFEAGEKTRVLQTEIEQLQNQIIPEWR